MLLVMTACPLTVLSMPFPNSTMAADQTSPFLDCMDHPYEISLYIFFYCQVNCLTGNLRVHCRQTIFVMIFFVHIIVLYM